mgnify:FL=1
MSRRKSASVITIAGGDCFGYAAMTAIKNNRGVVVHALVRPWGKKYHHAWLERRGKVYDWQTMTLGNKKPVPVATFYRIYTPTSIIRYTALQAAKNVLKYQHMGPWD